MEEINKAYRPVKQKTFLLRMPVDLWKAAKDHAEKQCETLHNYIITAMAEKVERDNKET